MIERRLVACVVLVPETNRFHPVESQQIGVPRDVQLALDVLEASLQAHAARGETQIEVRNRHPQALEAGLEVGDIEDAAEKRDQQVGLVEFFLDDVTRQIVTVDQGAHTSLAIETDEGHLPIAGGQPGRFDVEIERPWAESREQSPVIPGMQAVGKVPGVVAVELLLGRREVDIVQDFA